MDEAADLLGERAHQARVVVAERIHSDAGERVEILLAGLVPQPYALAAHERDRLAGVRVHDMAHGATPFTVANAKRRSKEPPFGESYQGFAPRSIDPVEVPQDHPFAGKAGRGA